MLTFLGRSPEMDDSSELLEIYTSFATHFLRDMFICLRECQTNAGTISTKNIFLNTLDVILFSPTWKSWCRASGITFKCLQSGPPWVSTHVFVGFRPWTPDLSLDPAARYSSKMAPRSTFGTTTNSSPAEVHRLTLNHVLLLLFIHL